MTAPASSYCAACGEYMPPHAPHMCSNWPPKQHDPMAILHWDFSSLHQGVRIKGSTEIRSAGDAAKIRDLMNKEHGDGSHWVETLNGSWEERHAVRAEDS